MIKVYDAGNLVDAQLVCDWLRDDGIEAHVQGSYLSGAVGELPADATISVWIRDALYKIRARELIEQFEHDRNRPYEITNCGSCGEQVEGNYAVCWNCGTPLPEPQ